MQVPCEQENITGIIVVNYTKSGELKLPVKLSCNGITKKTVVGLGGVYLVLILKMKRKGSNNVQELVLTQLSIQ